MMSRFQGKVAIITGSSSGIGAATAVLFAKDGAKVTITGRNHDGLEATKKAMLEAGAKDDHVNVVATDVTDALGRERIITSTIRKFGKLDILVNNAGAAFRDEKGLMGMMASTDMLQKTMNVNVNSVVELIQLARPHLVANKGEIVNVSSIAGRPLAFTSSAYYAMAKAALDQMMRALAIEIIAEGVRVNNVSPGAVSTNFSRNVGIPDEMATKIHEYYKQNPAILPTGRVASPSDIANIIAFLADRSQSFFILGQTIVADGGTSLVLALAVINAFTAPKQRNTGREAALLYRQVNGRPLTKDFAVLANSRGINQWKRLFM